MNFKIDTKEKFSVITPQSQVFDANIAEELWKAATMNINEERGNIVVNLQNISSADASVSNLVSLQQHFHAAKKSFVICSVQPQIIELFKSEDLIDTLTITPTESEAVDVVQMEEIERELMNDFEDKEDELNP